ncbi:hypothetical protein [Corynebacterium ureicelerivorans]|uniref:hypothetical protein n=1 Tax=Corynebacterium ureicelerivorans TaxID=401472 RepID=UPI000A913B7D|nr:hypothetical protein [Corynebacterium ureicelerivorans]
MGLNDILSNIDLNTVILHLDNFVDTWKGWGKIIEGLVDLTEIPANLAEVLSSDA